MIRLRRSWTYFKATINLKFITILNTLILKPLRSKNRSKTGLNQLRPRPVQDQSKTVKDRFRAVQSGLLRSWETGRSVSVSVHRF